MNTLIRWFKLYFTPDGRKVLHMRTRWKHSIYRELDKLLKNGPRRPHEGICCNVFAPCWGFDWSVLARWVGVETKRHTLFWLSDHDDKYGLRYGVDNLWEDGYRMSVVQKMYDEVKTWV